MIGADDRAFAADDVAGTLYAGESTRRLRFLMTDNSGRAHVIAFGATWAQNPYFEGQRER